MTNSITSLITSISILFSTFFPTVLGDQTTNKCQLPPAEQSTLSQYAQKRNFNVSGQINQCFKTDNPLRTTCQQTAINEFPGMFVPYQDHWATTEKTRGSYNFTKFDEVITFSRNNNSKLHFYHLVWTNHNKNTYPPKWLFPEPGQCGNWSKQELDQIMKTHIQAMISHAGDMVTVWNVVNEAFEENGSMVQDCFYKIIGLDYIDKAFRYARQATPHALLVLNEFFGRDRMLRSKVDGFFTYVKSAKNRGVPIDAVGLQNHLLSKNGDQFGSGYLDDLNYFFQKAQNANVKVLITEMDVYQAGHSQEDVAQLYKKVTAMCLKYSNCISLEVWGISDKDSWARLPQFANLPDAKPLLFDETYQRKLAYYGVMDAIRENNTRPCVGNLPTPTQTPTPTFKPTNTPTRTPTRTPTIKPTITPTQISTPTLKPTQIPTYTSTRTPTSVLKPTQTLTNIPTIATNLNIQNDDTPINGSPAQNIKTNREEDGILYRIADAVIQFITTWIQYFTKTSLK
ncbi:MAG: endo-1,4-beta-xylanase [Candidatus Gottesmanbacteria bacterium]